MQPPILHAEHTTSSPEHTYAIGQQFGRYLRSGAIVCFFGDLGAGKTTFIKGMLQAAADIPADMVNSPTFQYVNVYATHPIPVSHFDLYRLQSSEDFLGMGFDDTFDGYGIVCIEWAEKIQDILPNHAWQVHITYVDAHTRHICIYQGE